MNYTFLAPCLLTLLSLVRPLYATETSTLLTEPLLKRRWSNMVYALQNQSTTKEDLGLLVGELDADILTWMDEENKTLFDHAVENNRPAIARRLLDMNREIPLDQSIINVIDNKMFRDSQIAGTSSTNAWLTLQQMANRHLKQKPLSRKQKLRKLFAQCLGLDVEV